MLYSKKKRDDPEAREQAALFVLIRWHLKLLPLLEMAYHTPNGGLRDKITAAKLVGQGVSPGFPDIGLPAARRGYAGLYIEMKAPGALSDTSPSQKWWLAHLWQEGCLTLVCDGATEAWEIIKWYAGGTRGGSPEAWPCAQRVIPGSRFI